MVTRFAILAIALLPSFSMAQQNKISSDVLTGKPGLVDQNDNYFSPDIQGRVIWNDQLQKIQNEIDKDLVLPQSLVRSFILVGENNLLARKTNQDLDPHTLNQLSKSSHGQYISEFVNASAMSAAYLAQPTPRQSELMFNMMNAGKSSALVNSLRQSRANSRPSVQILIGDDSGTTGITSLIESYAKATGRTIVRFLLTRDVDVHALANRIQQESRNSRAILVFEDLSRLSPQAIAYIEALVRNPGIAGDASIILTTKDVLGFYSLSDEMMRNVDVYQFVKAPQSPEYYRQILEMRLPQVLQAIAQRENSQRPLILNNQHSLVKALSVALYGAQQKARHSMLRDMENILYWGVRACDAQLVQPAHNTPELTAAAEAYGQALAEAIANAN